MKRPLRAGSVMYNIRCRALAPSTAAASYCSWSMRDIAARKMIVPQPASFQMTWLVISPLNSSGTPMIWMIGRSCWTRNVFSMPALPSICWNSATTITQDRKCGM